MSRQVLDAIHKWFGLFALFFLGLQAISGVLIVNGERTQQWLDPTSYRLAQPAAGRASLDVLARSAIAQNGEAIASLVLPESQTSPVLAIVVPTTRALPEMVAIHPETGEVIGRKPVLSNPVVLTNLLHGELGAGNVGRAILMLAGISLAVLSVTGFLRWWPGWGRLGRSLRLRWAGSLGATLWQWHAVVGAVLAVLFLWLGVTGALLVGRPFVEQLVNAADPSRNFPELSTAAQAPSPAPRAVISLDAALAKAQHVMGDDELRTVLPVSRSSPVSTFVFADHQGRMGVVHLSPAGDVTERYRPSEMPATNRLLDWMLPLHRGTMLPEWLRTVYYLLAAGLVLLACSGLVINRKKARLRRRAKRSSSDDT